MFPQASVLAAVLPALTLLLPGGVSGLVIAPRATNYTQEAIDSGAVLSDLNKQAYSNVLARLGNATAAGQNGTAQCTKDNVRVRREW